jgi:hypothetical protein
LLRKKFIIHGSSLLNICRRRFRSFFLQLSWAASFLFRLARQWRPTQRKREQSGTDKFHPILKGFRVVGVIKDLGY